MISIFYDGSCGICAREIAYYQRISPPHKLNFIDISQANYNPDKHQLSVAQGMSALHVKDAAGRWHIGVDAFIKIWQALPQWRILALLVKLPLIYHATKLAYRGFLRWRESRPSHCVIDTSNEKSS